VTVARSTVSIWPYSFSITAALEPSA